MGAISIQKFLGEAPKLDPELLPNSAAQIATNVKLFSGDLTPYNQSSLVQALPKTGPITSVYPIDNGTGGFYWLHWNTDVDAIRAPVPNNSVGLANDQRTYYTGDVTGNGEPKATTATMAINGAGTAYPYTYYTLGLPAPLTGPTISATSFAPITLSTLPTRAVSGAALVTVTTPSAHGLNTGAYVTISGATGDTSFNVTNAQITVTGTTTFTYYAAGTTTTAVGTIVVNLGGLSTARTYVYTWITKWGEESAPSPVSNTQFVYEGQTVTVSGLPATFPTTGVYAGGVYQTNSASTAITGAANNGSGLFRITSAGHGLVTGGRTVIAGAGGVPTANANWAVTVIDANTFDLVGSTYAGTYTSGGTSSPITMTLNIYRTVASTTGTTYYLSGNVPLGTTTFTDNLPLTSLVTYLPSTTWYPPPAGLKGIRAIHNGILVGFFGTTVCFSQPGQPHSWPTAYYQEIGRTVVAVGNVGTTVVVLTDANPWIIQGSTPAVMQKVRLDTNMPCVSKRSMVSMDWGLCYATRGGIAVFSLYQGASLPTNYVYDWDNFRTIVDPTTITAIRYNNKYMAQHSQGMFIFEKDDHTGGFLTETNQGTTALYYNTNTAQVFFAQGTPSSLFLWDDPTQPYNTFQWKSKVFRTKDFLNIGAARVIANFAGGTSVTNANAVILANNISYINNHITAGPLAGSGTRFTTSPTGTNVDIGGSLGQIKVAGSRIAPQLSTTSALTMYFYVNGTLASTATVVNDTPFRLPTGYRVDKFEVQLIGNAPVRQVQLGETPMSLRAV